MQDSENEAIILLQLEDYKYFQSLPDKVLLLTFFHRLTCFETEFEVWTGLMFEYLDLFHEP